MDILLLHLHVIRQIYLTVGNSIIRWTSLKPFHLTPCPYGRKNELMNIALEEKVSTIIFKIVLSFSLFKITYTWRVNVFFFRWYWRSTLADLAPVCHSWVKVSLIIPACVCCTLHTRCPLLIPKRYLIVSFYNVTISWNCGFLFLYFFTLKKCEWRQIICLSLGNMFSI